jgi:hypothetical protein
VHGDVRKLQVDVDWPRSGSVGVQLCILHVACCQVRHVYLCSQRGGCEGGTHDEVRDVWLEEESIITEGVGCCVMATAWAGEPTVA